MSHMFSTQDKRGQGGLVVSVLVHGLSSTGLKTGQGCCVVFLGKTPDTSEMLGKPTCNNLWGSDLQ